MADTERREWLDEFEEAGWTKHIGGDGSLQYERPCRGSVETQTFLPDGGYRSSRPIDPVIIRQMPTATRGFWERGLWERLRRWWWR